MAGTQSVQSGTRKTQQSKAQRTAGVVERAMANAKTSETKTAQTGDQKPASTPATAPTGDQKGAQAEPKKAKKVSGTVVAWKEAKKQDLDPKAKITLVEPAKWPQGTRAKRGEALVRFNLYKSGMSIEDYVAASKAAGNSVALAKADIHWDITKGFITVK